jgi:signal transduction histidine kinase
VDLQEAERQHLAMELHDEVLNQLGLMVIEPHHVGEPLSASQVYHNLTMRLRSIITGLRPTMLNYGLRAALDELSDEILDLSNDRLQVLVKIENEPAELPADVELHIFRIIQEACRNTLKHSRARNIIISGRLSTNLINITIDDDGEGFEVGDHPDLEGLVSAKHFGLAGMYERAKLINAMLHLSSAPGQGTHLTIWWRDSH